MTITFASRAIVHSCRISHLHRSLNDDDVEAAPDGRRDCRLQRRDVIYQMAVLISLMDGVFGQAASIRTRRVNWICAKHMIDLHIASFDNDKAVGTFSKLDDQRRTGLRPMSFRLFLLWDWPLVSRICIHVITIRCKFGKLFICWIGYFIEHSHAW
jgi:hypothetical protein